MNYTSIRNLKPRPSLLKWANWLFFLIVVSSCAKEKEDQTIQPTQRFNDKPLGMTIDKLYKGFQEPPAEARPIVFWWWNNNQVTEEEAVRELEVLHKAGISGVTIIPIKEPLLSWHGEKLSAAEELEWQGKAWNNVVLATAKKAKELGMTVDIYPGSGWPYGGPFAKEKEKQVMRFGVFRDTVKGPASYEKPVDELLGQTLVHVQGRYRKVPVNPSLRYVWIRPVGAKSMDESKEIISQAIDDGNVKLDIPEGEYIITFGIEETGHRHPHNTVKGAAGPAIDHFQKGITHEYLTKNKEKMEAVWKEPVGNHLNAFFDESIELHGGNWTQSFPSSFEERKGYDIAPYLHFVVAPEKDEFLASGILEEIRRARYDYCEHLCHLIHENHFKEVHRFNRENGMMSRIQVYGSPDYFDIAKGSMIPDMVETDSWLYTVDPYGEESFSWGGDLVVNLYAAAGGNLRNKRMISNETMTNVLGLFQTTLATIKQSDDINFITGINKATLHGFNFSPPDAPFPGLVRFGTFFSEYNTWWPYIRNFTDYNARLSHVFQVTDPTAEIALLAPTSDVWSKYGLRKSEFAAKPFYVHRLWESIAQLGGNSHYLHEEIIQEATKENGLLTYGALSFPVLMVVEMESMQPETAEAIQQFAEQGGKVIFIDRVPSTLPGMGVTEEGEKRVQQAIAATMQAGGIEVSPPDANEKKVYWKWMKDVCQIAGIETKVTIESPQKGLYHKGHELEGEDILFFANTYREQHLNKKIKYKIGEKGLWIWNPETGERTPYNLPYDEDGFELDLRPMESVLLVSSEKKLPVKKRLKPTGEIVSLKNEWQLTFMPVNSQEYFTLNTNSLFEFTKSPDEKIKQFSGVVHYSTTFQLKEKGNFLLELGKDNDHISEVTLNGKKVGVNWYGSKWFDVSDAIQVGENKLKIRYTTTLWNKMRNTEQGVMFQKKYKRPITPLKTSGLLGPIRLMKEAE